jgi:hypothetical protein
MSGTRKLLSALEYLERDNLPVAHGSRYDTDAGDEAAYELLSALL